MNYWLIKSEPQVYNFNQLVKDKKTVRDGVRNYTARNYLREMRKGDQAFFYHSNEGLEIVGIAEIIKESYPDPTTDNSNWVAVDFKPVKKLNKPVLLKEIKNEPSLAEMQLVTNSRLSVQKVTTEEWEKIIEMAQ